jgi:hypothetical protein
MAVVVKCRQCKQDVEVPATEDQIKRWRAGELIQRAMPNLTADEREILISGICGTCFDRMFPDDEEMFPDEEEKGYQWVP